MTFSKPSNDSVTSAEAAAEWIERQNLIRWIIFEDRDSRGAQRPGEEAVGRMINVWLGKFHHIPTALLRDAAISAQNYRPNQASALTWRDVCEAFARMVTQGRAEAPGARRDPHCPDCRGLGFTFVKQAAGTGSGDYLAGSAERVYETAKPCNCVEGQFPSPDTSGVSSMIEWMAKEFGGHIPEIDRQAVAAKRLLEAGWSRRDIFDCWKSLTPAPDSPATFAAVWFTIGPWFAKQELADLWAKVDVARQARLKRDAEISSMAETLNHALTHPMSESEMVREKSERERERGSRKSEDGSREEAEL